MKRQIIQLCKDANVLVALCNDGTTWGIIDGEGGWLPDYLPPIPQPEPDEGYRPEPWECKSAELLVKYYQGEKMRMSTWPNDNWATLVYCEKDASQPLACVRPDGTMTFFIFTNSDNCHWELYKEPTND
jgi:hypothetical protein